MRWLIHGSEQPRHLAHFASILEHLNQSKEDEYLFFSAKDEPGPHTFHPKSWLLHKMRDIVWDRLSYTPNRFNKSRWKWVWKRAGEEPEDIVGPPNHWRRECKPIRGKLPWKPDIILGASPHEGHMKYHLIPWAHKHEIPIVAIDHGLPTQVNPMAAYRATMMGCDAWACWGEFACDVNAVYGAPRKRMVATGSPTIDHYPSLKLPSNYRQNIGVEDDKRMILLMTTHRDPMKSWSDSVFAKVVNKFGSDEKYQIVVKPHPVELAQGGLMDFGPDAVIIKEQSELHHLVMAADVIISPSTSVIVPAMAFHKPFVDLFVPEATGFEGVVDTSLINELLFDAVFHPNELEDAVMGVKVVDVEACEVAFEKLAKSQDGRNGERIVSLCRHIDDGGKPWDWVEPT